MEEALNELLKFVQIGARLDLKAVAVEHVLGKSLECLNLRQFYIFFRAYRHARRR